MDFATAFAELVDKYGLPLIMLGVLGYALWKRILILGSEKERSDLAFERELAYREERRQEERAGRLAAETALRKVVDGSNKLVDGFEDLSALVAESLKRNRS